MKLLVGGVHRGGEVDPGRTLVRLNRLFGVVAMHFGGDGTEAAGGLLGGDGIVTGGQLGGGRGRSWGKLPARCALILLSCYTERNSVWWLGLRPGTLPDLWLWICYGIRVNFD